MRYETIDKLNLNLSVTKSFIELLFNHFDCKRFKDNPTLDHWSVTRNFNAYNDLLNDTYNKICDCQEILNKEMKSNVKTITNK